MSIPPLDKWNEEVLFSYLKLNCYPDLVMSNKQMSRWDCYSPMYKYRIELKCRKAHYDSLMLEKIKYDAMIEKCKDHGDDPLYINSTPNGVYEFNLNDITPKWEKMSLSKTTEFENTDKVRKEIAMIPVIDAVQLK